MATAWENLPGSTGDAYARLCGTTGDTYERLAGTTGDTWARLLVACGEVISSFARRRRRYISYSRRRRL